MEHLREFKEVEAFSDPSRTRDVSVSASLGAMRPLLGKLDKLLHGDAPAEGCSSESVQQGMGLLKNDVDKMSSYLDQLSEVEDPPPTAKCWMNEARDLSYDMEDYMDSLLFVQPAGPSLIATGMEAHEPIRAKVSEFRKCVQEAIERHKVYVVPDYDPSSTLRRRFVSLGPMLLPTPYEETADIVIDGRMNEFIDSLDNDGDPQLKVVSVLGSACLGKTTLARVLYDRIGKRYQCRAFIWVSKKPDMKRIFRDMLSQLQRQDPPEYSNEVDLIGDIKKYLQDKRYLIIIDDVRAASVWDIINHALPKGNRGSRIIATTQIADVALTCCCYQSEHVFEIKPLDDHHSRKLFFNRLFGSESNCPEQFKEVLNEIAAMCGGLPLATISIASLFASQPAMTIDLLTYVHQSLSSCFSANSTSVRMRKVLNLSFNSLPRYLKTCLLYLSMYQEGYTFCKDDLVKQWMAEGFIDTTEGQDMEKVAESYLHQLIGRRFIQPMCINYNNEVLSCAVHDVVHDLIAHKAAEENFTVAIDYSQKNVALCHKVRRLSLLFGDARYAKTPANIRRSQVRSLAYSGLPDCIPYIREFKPLRVLNLQLSSHHHGDQDPAIDLTGISELSHLIYLKIVCDVCIKLPNSMRGLQCLETLDVMDTTRGTHVPWDIMYLPHLLHLSLPADTNLLDWSVIPDRSLFKLNHLHDLYISTPPSSDHLERSMEALERSMEALELSMEALGSLIGGHGNLKTIVVAHGSSVRYGGASKATISWESLAPPNHLKRFEFSPHSRIMFYRIPRWMEQLGNLCILKIAVWELSIYDVDILRRLSALTALSLYVEKTPYNKIIFDKAGFLALRYFKLRFTSGIAWLKFEKDAMPNLGKLKLVFSAIPRMHQRLYLFSNRPPFKQYRHGSTLITIEHMPGLREISTKFRGAAADLEYVSRIGIVSNHPSNPIIHVQLVDSGSYGDKSTRQKQQADEILEQKPDEYDKALEIPTDKRTSSSSPESSSRTDVPGVNVHQSRSDDMSSSTQRQVPPGFRFHPTDEDLVDYYLRKKVASGRIDLNVIKEVDLYKIEPWDLQEICRIGPEKEQSEWYVFCPNDRKYPTGTRMSGATVAGYWKWTGRDKTIFANHCLVGMRKTLVYYNGRAPYGQKSDWILHEYRLETNVNTPAQEERWVLCKVFKKRLLLKTTRDLDHDAPQTLWLGTA